MGRITWFYGILVVCGNTRALRVNQESIAPSLATASCPGWASGGVTWPVGHSWIGWMLSRSTQGSVAPQMFATEFRILYASIFFLHVENWNVMGKKGKCQKCDVFKILSQIPIHQYCVVNKILALIHFSDMIRRFLLLALACEMVRPMAAAWKMTKAFIYFCEKTCQQRYSWQQNEAFPPTWVTCAFTSATRLSPAVASWANGSS